MNSNGLDLDLRLSASTELGRTRGRNCTLSRCFLAPTNLFDKFLLTSFATIPQNVTSGGTNEKFSTRFARSVVLYPTCLSGGAIATVNAMVSWV